MQLKKSLLVASTLLVLLMPSGVEAQELSGTFTFHFDQDAPNGKAGVELPLIKAHTVTTGNGAEVGSFGYVYFKMGETKGSSTLRGANVYFVPKSKELKVVIELETSYECRKNGSQDAVTKRTTERVTSWSTFRNNVAFRFDNVKCWAPIGQVTVNYSIRPR